MKKHWQILQPDAPTVQTICNALNCSPVTAKILVNRKILSEKDAYAFLNPSLNNIRPPSAIKDIDAAVHRIYEALTRHEKILIFGDYDVDGITATTILLEFLQYTGANVSYYIPHRSKEGYGLQIKHIIDQALPQGINLIITVDCGSHSHDAVEAARNAGIDVIITDHHNIPEKLPTAAIVVNPKRLDCPSGFSYLAGVGVSFYLLIHLRKYLRDKHFWHRRPEPNLRNFCDLVALGTIADIVPLVEENRILTKAGIEVINSGNRPGLKALMQVCGMNAKPADTIDIAYRLAPRLNAAGRIAHAKTAVHLLTTQSYETAMQIAGSLNHMNIRRQEIENEILKEIQTHLNTNTHLLEQKAIVLSHQGWHEGILGIVASKIVEKYYRPVVLLALKEGVGKGSARSVPEIDLYEALLACMRSIISFGGHSMAAGLKIKSEEIDRFQEDFENTVLKMSKQKDFTPEISIDCQLDFNVISADLIDELESLKPFGCGNPEPLFWAENIEVLSSKIVGKTHRRLVLRQPGRQPNKTVDAIQFNIDPRAPLEESYGQIAFRVRWNHWNDKKTEQIVIEELSQSMSNRA
jgi:single-stranded-DNA-specific exonuclease